VKINKSFDSLTLALIKAGKEAHNYGEVEMEEMILLLLELYLSDDEKEFHKFLLAVVDDFLN
jgi:hypothetical protein